MGREVVIAVQARRGIGRENLLDGDRIEFCPLVVNVLLRRRCRLNRAFHDRILTGAARPGGRRRRVLPCFGSRLTIPALDLS